MYLSSIPEALELKTLFILNVVACPSHESGGWVGMVKKNENPG
jgi:hypothetical protein